MTIQTPITRTTSPALDAMLGVKHPVLDHGFVRVVDYMGDDKAVVQAARVSYGDGTKAVSSDEGLLRYLMRRRHTTPFEMCEIKFHVKLPVFVARQWIRHRTANVNEISARYSVLDKEFYVPDTWHTQAKDNKQGSGEAMSGQVHVTDSYTRTIEDAFVWYDLAVSSAGDPKNNMAREQARMVLPLSTYTEWFWKIDLHNLLHFLQLRADPHAQAEIRAYADVMCEIVKQWMPLTWRAFEDYRLNAVTLSAQQHAVLLDLVRYLDQSRPTYAAQHDESVTSYLDAHATDMSGRELAELKQVLGGAS